MSKKEKKITKKKLASLARSLRKKQLSDWSKAVRDRDGNKCVVCGRTEHLNAHHLIPKERFEEFSLEIDNGITVCPTCHKFGAYSFHRHPLWSVAFLQKNRPDQFNWVMSKIPLDINHPEA